MFKKSPITQIKYNQNFEKYSKTKTFQQEKIEEPKMHSAMRSQHSMTRMLECFEREATKWLRHVEIEFDASNRQFDENFRQIFIQTSNDR